MGSDKDALRAIWFKLLIIFQLQLQLQLFLFFS